MRKTITFLSAILFSIGLLGQTTLAAGDIAFVGFNLDGADDYAFILLKDIDPSTTINFTDRGWNDSGGFFNSSGDATWTWTSTAALTVGTVITITNGTSASTGTISGATPTLSLIGDQILAYQGTDATPTFVAGMHSNFSSSTDMNWDGSASSNSTSALPDQLTNGTNAIRLHNSNTEVDNWQYNCTVVSGDITTVRAAINNIANWSFDNTNAYSPVAPPCVWSITAPAVAQTVTSVSVPANATYTAGQNLDFTVNFSGAITVVTTGGTPQIAITIGATVRQAAYVSGSGSANLLFRYTVQNGDLDTDGIALGTLATNGGTLQDGAGTDADLTLNSVGSTAAVLVDAAGPTVTTISIPNSPANVGDAITVIIVADESGLTLNTGQVNGVNVTGFTNIAGNTYSATYTVAEGNTDRAAGDNIPVNFILTDALSNNSTAFTTAISQNADAIDANTPTIISVSIPNSAANVGDAITVSVTASETGLSLNTGQVNGVNVTGFSDDGGGSYSATYTVTEGNTDRAAGDDIPVNFILTDAGGNSSTAFTTAISQNADAIDANTPTVTSVSIPNAAANVGDAITVTITAGESGLSLNTGQVNGVNVTGFSDDGGGSYSATYTVNEGNTDRAAGDDIPVNFILTDASGNNSVAFTTAISQNADAIDANSPSVTNISIPNAAANVGDAITVSVTASEAGLSLNTGQVNGVNVTGFSDDGGGSYSATYTVNEGNTDRAAGDDIPVNFILTDASGNNSVAFTTAISQNADAIDANTPTVTSVSIPNAAAKVGDAITVTITAGEAGLNLNTGQVNGVNVTGFSDDGGGSYSATYTVNEENTDRAAGDNIPVNFILTDASGNNSVAFITAISQNADAIDANTPNITSVNVPANATYTAGQNLDFTVNFNENINVVTTGGTPQIAITIGATVQQAQYISGSGSNALLFRYTVQVGNLDTDGIAIGTLSANSGTLRDAVDNDANLTLNSVGSTANVFVGNPTITWTGTTNNDWNTASNWNTNSVPTSVANVTIPSGLTNYPTISSAVTVNSIDIASAASLIANATVTASVTYRRNLPTTNWYLVAAPISGETQQDVIANHSFATGSGSNIGLGGYSNNTGPSWIYSTAASTGPIPSGIGISMKLAAPGDVSISGTINTSNVSYPISQGTRDNFNLIGNPYTSYINSATFASANTGTLTEETIWLWDGSQYVTYNLVSPINLAPAQGFFVEASGSGNVTYSTANQSHQNTDTFMRSVPKTSFELFVENGTKKKSTKVFYIDGKATGFDNGYDSKMFGGITQEFAVFTELLENNEGKKLAIQTLPNSEHQKMIIPVGIIAKAGEKIEFSVNSENFPSGIEIYLEDRVNNTFANLSQEKFSTTLQKTAEGVGRFYIHTSSKSLSADDVIKNTASISIYKSSEKEITLTGLQGEATVKIYSTLGEELMNTKVNSNGNSKIEIPNLSTGIYIIRLDSNLGSISKKIILK